MRLASAFILASTILTACGGSGSGSSGGNQPPAGPGTPPPVDPPVKPVLSEVAALGTVHTFTPDYRFNSDSAGTLAFIGRCTSGNNQVVAGENTITLDALENGTYADCKITVTNDENIVSEPLAISSFTIQWKTHLLNDSGQTDCARKHEGGAGFFSCSATGTTQTSNGTVNAGGYSVPGAQDAVYGRDSDANNNDDADGEAGFSFSKLDQDGNELAFSAVDWTCVRDNVTGLTWRKQVLASAVFNASPSAEATCGINNWRIPAYQELMSITNYMGSGNKKFANDLWPGGQYWLAEQSATDSIVFHSDHGFRQKMSVGGSYPSILVSGTQLPDQSNDRFIIHDNATVTDIHTGLMWQRCILGETFNADSGACDLDPEVQGTQNWYQALQSAMANQFAGLDGWRLPNNKELNSLVDYSENATIVFNSSIFPTQHVGHIWSATPGKGVSQAYTVAPGSLTLTWVIMSGEHGVLLVRDVD